MYEGIYSHTMCLHILVNILPYVSFVCLNCDSNPNFVRVVVTYISAASFYAADPDV